jgi:hypothetical protein
MKQMGKKLRGQYYLKMEKKYKLMQEKLKKYSSGVRLTLAGLLATYTLGCSTAPSIRSNFDVSYNQEGKLEARVGVVYGKNDIDYILDKKGDYYVIEEKKNWFERNWKWIATGVVGFGAGYLIADMNKSSKKEKTIEESYTPATQQGTRKTETQSTTKPGGGSGSSSGGDTGGGFVEEE